MWVVYVLCLSANPYEMLIRSTSYLKSHAIFSASHLMLSMVLHYMNVKAVVSGLTWMHKTGCSAGTRVVLHVSSSS